MLLLYPGAEELDFKGLFCFQFSFGCLAGAWRPETCKKLTLSTGPLEGQTPSRSPQGISVLADCIEMNVEGVVQILVATERGEISFRESLFCKVRWRGLGLGSGQEVDAGDKSLAQAKSESKSFSPPPSSPAGGEAAP